MNLCVCGIVYKFNTECFAWDTLINWMFQIIVYMDGQQMAERLVHPWLSDVALREIAAAASCLAFHQTLNECT